MLCHIFKTLDNTLDCEFRIYHVTYYVMYVGGSQGSHEISLLLSREFYGAGLIRHNSSMGLIKDKSELIFF